MNMRCSLFSFLKPFISFKSPPPPFLHWNMLSISAETNKVFVHVISRIFRFLMRFTITDFFPSAPNLFLQDSSFLTKKLHFFAIFSNFRIGSFAFVWLYDHVYSTIVLYPITHINIVHRIPNNKRTFSGMKIDFLFCLHWVHFGNMWFYTKKIWNIFILCKYLIFFVVSKWTVL